MIVKAWVACAVAHWDICYTRDGKALEEEEEVGIAITWYRPAGKARRWDVVTYGKS